MRKSRAKEAYLWLFYRNRRFFTSFAVPSYSFAPWKTIQWVHESCLILLPFTIGYNFPFWVQLFFWSIKYYSIGPRKIILFTWRWCLTILRRHEKLFFWLMKDCLMDFYRCSVLYFCFGYGVGKAAKAYIVYMLKNVNKWKNICKFICNSNKSCIFVRRKRDGK